MNAEQRKTTRLQTTRLIQVAIITPVYVTADARERPGTKALPRCMPRVL